MLERYTAVDVETPNRNNDSICSIGIVHMEYGTPVYLREFLVNPHEHFDDYNIKIHGITPEMVKDAPTFREIWPEIAPFFSGIMAAHSATFDLGVICKSLALCDIPIPDITYACTLTKARKHLPKEECGSHRLNDLCAGLNVPLEHHHNALDDALGCALILEKLIDRFGCDKSDLRIYSFTGVQSTVSPKERASAIRALWSVMELHDCRHSISADYHEALEDWARRNDRFLRDPDVRACHNMVAEVLERGAISEEEYSVIMGL
ncbi:MAG: 3'-5' exonuclease [Clostridia bacterium]|nr:3'-5' exonuclease [Clostridia bacterium]